MRRKLPLCAVTLPMPTCKPEWAALVQIEHREPVLRTLPTMPLHRLEDWVAWGSESSQTGPTTPRESGCLCPRLLGGWSPVHTILTIASSAVDRRTSSGQIRDVIEYYWNDLRGFVIIPEVISLLATWQRDSIVHAELSVYFDLLWSATSTRSALQLHLDTRLRQLALLARGDLPLTEMRNVLFVVDYLLVQWGFAADIRRADRYRRPGEALEVSLRRLSTSQALISRRLRSHVINEKSFNKVLDQLPLSRASFVSLDVTWQAIRSASLQISQCPLTPGFLIVG